MSEVKVNFSTSPSGPCASELFDVTSTYTTFGHGRMRTTSRDETSLCRQDSRAQTPRLMFAILRDWLRIFFFFHFFSYRPACLLERRRCGFWIGFLPSTGVCSARGSFHLRFMLFFFNSPRPSHLRQKKYPESRIHSYSFIRRANKEGISRDSSATPDTKKI